MFCYQCEQTAGGTGCTKVGVCGKNEDIQSLQDILIFGLKGIAAYADHASILGFRKDEINDFIMEALASTTKTLSVDEMIALVMKAGETAVSTMALLDQAINVTSQFLKGGNTLQEADAAGRRKVYPVRRGGIAPDIPMMVLINRGSASSSEIFAGALQDQGRAIVVGETTFGTGTVLRPFRLDDGSQLMLGTSQWLTANGRLIRKQGIEPDVLVELSICTRLRSPGIVEDLTAEELLESEDTQLLKALELLDASPEK